VYGRPPLPPQLTHLPFVRQQPVQRPGRDVFQHVGRPLAALQFARAPQPVHLLAQDRHQPQTGRENRRSPTGAPAELFNSAGVDLPPAAPPGGLLGRGRMGQLADQNLPIQPGALPRFVQKPGLLLLAGPPILFPQCFQILLA